MVLVLALGKLPVLGKHDEGLEFWKSIFECFWLQEANKLSKIHLT
jgi:hypothetical protein